MINLQKDVPPSYDQESSLETNFDRFFDWGMSLRQPMRQIPEIGERLGIGVKVHPIGFMVIYLSQHNEGLATVAIRGEARADLFPPDVVINEDIHSHGFNFYSGVVSGEIANTRHYPDFNQRSPDSEGYIGYESSVDVFGNNHTVRATDATIVIPTFRTEVLGKGGMYTMAPRIDFHSVSSEAGAITVFCKTPTFEGSDGQALVLRRPDRPPTPEIY